MRADLGISLEQILKEFQKRFMLSNAEMQELLEFEKHLLS